MKLRIMAIFIYSLKLCAKYCMKYLTWPQDGYFDHLHFVDEELRPKKVGQLAQEHIAGNK